MIDLQPSDNMAEYVRLCSALGINVRNMEPGNVYLTAGKIIRDVCSPTTNALGTVLSMTDDQKRDLRERVLGVLAFPSPSQRKR